MAKVTCVSFLEYPLQVEQLQKYSHYIKIYKFKNKIGKY